MPKKRYLATKDQCPVAWNPGEWPYATRCRKPKGHQGKHQDHRERTLVNLGPRQERASEG